MVGRVVEGGRSLGDPRGRIGEDDVGRFREAKELASILVDGWIVLDHLHFPVTEEGAHGREVT